MNNTVAVLGASDPEMQAIRGLLAEVGIPVHQATCGGVPVHPGNAYKANGIDPPLPPDCTVWRVECDGPALAGIPADRIVVIDHHRPGDPGYGRPPEEFFAASSIGQVLAMLPFAQGERRSTIRVRADRQHILRDVTIAVGAPRSDLHGGCTDPEHCQQHSGLDRDGAPMVGAQITVSGQAAHRMIVERVHVAAADHCLEAAYRGRCPGVDPDALMRWRAESRAAFQGRPVEAVLADIEAARNLLRDAVLTPLMAVGPNGICEGCGIKCCPTEEDGSWDYCECPELVDLREEGKIPELPEASAREGIPFLAIGLERDGRRKVVLQSAPPRLIESFLTGKLVPGLADMYGDPARGFAGGYIPSA